MILTIEHGKVRELRLNRPPANALAPELVTRLKDAIERAPREGVRALVLSGTPGRFSGGLDVPLLLTLDRPAMATLWNDFYALLHALACSPIPIAAAITGHAPAGGTVLALFCDRRFVAQGEWKLGLNEVRVGIPLPPVILGALQRVVGMRQAEWLAVTGALISPAEAARIGLVDEVVPPDSTIKAAVGWCEELLSFPGTAVSLTRQKARADLAALFASGMDVELREVIATWWSDETQTVLRRLAEELAKKKAKG